MATARMPHHAKQADAWDIELGRRLRTRRMECQMSQTKLGAGLGITFQQIQKYERGVNRVSAGRMRRICELLQVPVSYFYEAEGSESPGSAKGAADRSLFPLLQQRDAVQMVRAFSGIHDHELRRILLRLTELAGRPEKAPRP
jgi:transcriptional regulator with XRE-family HTH domain